MEEYRKSVPSRNGADAGESDHGLFDSGFFKVPNVFVLWMLHLSRAAILVYIRLRRAANPGEDASAGIQWLAGEIDLDAANVRPAVKQLAETPLIEIVIPASGWGGRTQYRLPLNPPPPDQSLAIRKPVRKRTDLKTDAQAHGSSPKRVRLRAPNACASAPHNNNCIPRTPEDQELLLPNPAAPEPADASIPKAKRKSRHESLKELAPYRQLTDFWLEQKRREDPGFVFIDEDGVHLAALWKRSGQNLMRAKGAIVAYMSDGYFEGHSAIALRGNLDKFLARAMNGGAKRNGSKLQEKREQCFKGGVAGYEPPEERPA